MNPNGDRRSDVQSVRDVGGASSATDRHAVPIPLIEVGRRLQWPTAGGGRRPRTFRHSECLSDPGHPADRRGPDLGEPARASGQIEAHEHEDLVRVGAGRISCVDIEEVGVGDATGVQAGGKLRAQRRAVTGDSGVQADVEFVAADARLVQVVRREGSRRSGPDAVGAGGPLAGRADQVDGVSRHGGDPGWAAHRDVVLVGDGVAVGEAGREVERCRRWAGSGRDLDRHLQLERVMYRRERVVVVVADREHIGARAPGHRARDGDVEGPAARCRAGPEAGREVGQVISQGRNVQRRRDGGQGDMQACAGRGEDHVVGRNDVPVGHRQVHRHCARGLRTGDGHQAGRHGQGRGGAENKASGP